MSFRYNNSFRQQSGPATAGRVSPSGALNQLGAMKMESSWGQSDVRAWSAASSAFASLQSFLTFSRDNCHTFEGVELPLPTWVTCEITCTPVGFNSQQLKAPEDSSLRACSPAVWAATDRSKRAEADASTAVGVEGSSSKEAYQLSISLSREGASAGFAEIGTHTSSRAMS